MGYPGHDPEIYTINASGRDKIQLTHNNKNEFDLSYSPNGKRIVYAGFPGLEDKAESDTTRSTPSGVVRPKLPTPTTRTKSILPGGVVRSGFSSGRSQRPLGLGEGRGV